MTKSKKEKPPVYRPICHESPITNEALRKKGLRVVRDNIPVGFYPRISGGLVWAFFGPELLERAQRKAPDQSQESYEKGVGSDG